MCTECAGAGGQLELLETQFRLSTREGAVESLNFSKRYHDWMDL